MKGALGAFLALALAGGGGGSGPVLVNQGPGPIPDPGLRYEFGGGWMTWPGGPTRSPGSRQRRRRIRARRAGSHR